MKTVDILDDSSPAQDDREGRVTVRDVVRDGRRVDTELNGSPISTEDASDAQRCLRGT